MRPETPERLVQRVGERIAELRRAAGMTQEAFAESLDVTVQYISRIEVGENLTLTTLAKIARALGVTVIDLLQPPGPTGGGPTRGRPRKRTTRN
jgi:transcriptional regulator with XRE-family HTH domain